MKTNKIIIFADGACLGNPGPGGWGAIILDQYKKTVTELAGANRHATNNQMELEAAIQALSLVENSTAPVLICTDSSYLINGVTKWLRGWLARDWKTIEGKDVLNRDRWEKLSALVNDHRNRVEWKHVAGHVGIPGNERADELATGMAGGSHPDLYSGSAQNYPVDLSIHVAHLPASTQKLAEKKRKKAPAFSYLSLVDGKLMRHATWAECEQRVKGRANVKFKKTISAEDERNILQQWGFKK